MRGDARKGVSQIVGRHLARYLEVRTAVAPVSDEARVELRFHLATGQTSQ
jgi:hypothetical protein